MKKYFLLLVVLIAGQRAVQAQVDPHFSQYYIYPSWLNPALTGAFNGDYRVSGVYRGQWSNIAGGFKTFGLAADAVTEKNLNVGVNLFQQSAGTGYNYLNTALSFAYTGVRFGEEGKQVIALGINAGLLNRRFDPSKFQTGDQWTPGGGYNPNAPTNEFLTNRSALAFDASVGAMYYDMTPGKAVNPYVGVSVSHLTQPEDNFTSGTVKSKLPMRYTLHGGLALAVSEGLTINPNLLYLRQGNAEEKMIGAYAQISAAENLDLLGGINYRFKDAVVPFVGVDYNNFLIGASYDVNQTSLGRTPLNANTFEITLSYIFRKAKLLGLRNISCPRL